MSPDPPNEPNGSLNDDMEPSQRSSAADDFLGNLGSDAGPRVSSREASPEPPQLPNSRPNSPDHSVSASVSDLWDQGLIRLEGLRLTTDFIAVLQLASLDDPISGLSDEALDCLRSPSRAQPAQLIDEDSKFAIDLYLANPSDATYEVNRAIFLRRYPDTSLPSYYKTKRLVADLMGIESIVHVTFMPKDTYS